MSPYELPEVDPDLLDKALLQAAQWQYPGRKITIIRRDPDPALSMPVTRNHDQDQTEQRQEAA